MLKIETIQIDAGETPMGTFTMAAHKPRRKVKARVIRESTWRHVRRVLAIAESESWVYGGGNNGTFQAVEKLRSHLEWVSQRRNGTQ